MTYQQAKDEAQRLSDMTGFDVGVEPDAFGYHYHLLPQKRERFGHELTCEVVSCTVLAKTRPGHGWVG